MSEKKLATEIADLLRPTAADAAKSALNSQVKHLEDTLGARIETCIDGKCESIAAMTAKKLQPELKDLRSQVEGALSIKGHTPHDIFDCPTCKPIALSHLLQDEKHRDGLLETVCKDGVCKPIVADTLWKDSDYRKDVLGKILKDETQRGSLLEGICTDETCRNDLLKLFKEKNIEVTENGGRKEESWVQRRLRKRRESAGKTS